MWYFGRGSTFYRVLGILLIMVFAPAPVLYVHHVTGVADRSKRSTLESPELA